MENVHNIYLDVHLPNDSFNIKEQVISQYAKKLAFPEYWSENWDSFEECLIDKLRENKSHLHIRHIGWVKLDFDKLKPYIEILEDIKSKTASITIRELN